MVYRCILVSAVVYRCILVSAVVYRCILVSAVVYRCILVSAVVYRCILQAAVLLSVNGRCISATHHESQLVPCRKSDERGILLFSYTVGKARPILEGCADQHTLLRSIDNSFFGYKVFKFCFSLFQVLFHPITKQIGTLPNDTVLEA